MLNYYHSALQYLCDTVLLLGDFKRSHGGQMGEKISRYYKYLDFREISCRQLQNVNMAELEEELNTDSVELGSPLLAEPRGLRSFRSVRNGEKKYHGIHTTFSTF